MLDQQARPGGGADVDRTLTNRVYTVLPGVPVSDVVRLMVSHNLGDVIVVTEGKPVGILTDRDIVVRVIGAGLNPRDVRVKEAMSTPPVTVKQDEDLSVAVGLMRQHGIRRIPIVDDTGRLCSIVTLDDLLMLGLEDCPDLGGVLWRQVRPGRTMPEPAPRDPTWHSSPGRKADLYLPRKRVTAVARASVIVPMTDWSPVRRLRALRAWYFNNRTWLLVVFLLAWLGAGVAFVAGYVGELLQTGLERQSEHYTPSDEERRLFLEERRQFFEKEEQRKQGR